MAVPFGIVLMWLGYGMGYLGYSRIKGGNNTFMQVFWPGRYQYMAPDSGGGLTEQQLSDQYNAAHPQGLQPAPTNPAKNEPAPSVQQQIINQGGNIGVSG